MKKLLKKLAFPTLLLVILLGMSWLMIRNYEAVDHLNSQGKPAVSIVTPGTSGKDGESAYQIAVRNGYKGSETDWLETFRGQAGGDGLTAYQVAVKNGYNGSESDWLASLVGPRGQSAYDVAVANGFTGTQSQWLASLIGPKGDTGATGATGMQGPQGEQGLAGANGQDVMLSCVIRGDSLTSTKYISWKYTIETDSQYRDLYKLPTWAECVNPVDLRTQ